MLSEGIAHSYLQDNTISALHARFSNNRPFPHLLLKDFLLPSFARKLAMDVRREPFFRQDSDLFSFSQTRDLKRTSLPHLKQFSTLLASRAFKAWLGSLTSLHLRGHTDCSAFLYRSGDYLLPHDDSLGTRKIAYTYYLSEHFSRRDGGALEFFDQDTVTLSLPPRFNSLILFPVIASTTIHQVSEVLRDKERLSIAGWFHDTPLV